MLGLCCMSRNLPAFGCPYGSLMSRSSTVQPVCITVASPLVLCPALRGSVCVLPAKYVLSWDQPEACYFAMQPKIVFHCESESRFMFNPEQQMCKAGPVSESIMPSDIRQPISCSFHHTQSGNLSKTTAWKTDLSGQSCSWL